MAPPPDVLWMMRVGEVEALSPLCWWVAYWLFKKSEPYYSHPSKRSSDELRRYVCLSFLSDFRMEYQSQLKISVYKYWAWLWVFSKLSHICKFSNHLKFSGAWSIVNWCGIMVLSKEHGAQLDKGKGKYVFPPRTSNDQISKAKLKLGSSPIPIVEKFNKSQDLPNLKSQEVPNTKLPLSVPAKKSKTKKGSCSNPKCDLTAMFQKLAAVRENGKKKKELTLVGILVGEPKEFPRLFAKLRMEWKPLVGTLVFNILKAGWFEISLSNPADFNRIWTNQPYHMFSQLLLLKKWYPGFDPTSESISQLDLWVRLHYLPEEFANKDALETIIEGNGIGKFLKMDPSHNSERWNMFTRFCIHTDVEETMGRGVIVPDEFLNQIKYSLWFDDFSLGCGACGKSGHVFKDCPNKYASTPKLQLTLRKPSSKNHANVDPNLESLSNEDWCKMGKGNKIIKEGLIYSIPSNNVYLTEKGGINIIYESEDSDEGLQSLLKENEHVDLFPTLISVAADLHPYNGIMETKQMMNRTSETCIQLPGDTIESKDYKQGKETSGNLGSQHMENREFPGPHDKNNLEKSYDQESKSMENKNEDAEVWMDKVREKEDKLVFTKGNSSNEPAELNKNLEKECSLLSELDEEQYDEEQLEYEYDDLIVDDTYEGNIQENLNITHHMVASNHILISDDPPFSEQDLEEFINNEPAIMEPIQISPEGSYHSIQNSFLSSSSFAVEMGKLEVYQPETSNTTSGKRRTCEGEEDTATSMAKKGKKPKN